MIREFDRKKDLDALKRCIIELQDFESGLDPRMPGGVEIVEEYIPLMLKRCADYGGKLFVAMEEGEVAGYVSVWCFVPAEDPDEGPKEYGLVSDLSVLTSRRGRGIGRALLLHAEEYARAERVQWLRISVLAKNRPAYSLYKSSGFNELEVVLEKELAGFDRP